MSRPLRLLIIQPDGSSADRTFSKLPVRLGRGSENDVVLNDENVSRIHAEFHLVGDDIFVRDCESLNGIRLNNEVVLDAAVTWGDILQMGRCEVQVLQEDASETTRRREDGEDELLVRPDGTGGVLEVIRAIDIEKVLKFDNHSPESFALRNPFEAEEVKLAVPRLHRAYNNLLVIMNLVSKVGNYSHPSQVCEQFVSALKQVFPLVENVAVVEYDDTLDSGMRFIFQEGFDDDFMSKSHPSRTVLQRVHNELRAVYAVDARRDPRFIKSDSVLVRGVRSMMCTPLVTRAEARGALYVENLTQPYCFGQFDLNFLTVFAFHLGIAMETSRLLAERDDSFERAVQAIKAFKQDKTALLVQYSQSERKFRALFEQSALGAAVINLVTGNIEEVNDGLVRMLGFSRRQLTGMSFWQLLNDHSRAQAEEWLLHVRQNGEGSFKTRLRSSSGTSLVALMSCRALRMGDSLVMAAYFIDITAKEYAEAQTKTQLLRVTALSELSQALMTTMDIEAIQRLLFEKVLTVLPLEEFMFVTAEGEEEARQFRVTFAARKDEKAKLQKCENTNEVEIVRPFCEGILTSGETYVKFAGVRDVRQAPTNRKPYSFKPGSLMASAVAVPIIARHGINGLVIIQTSEVRAYDSSHMETLHALVAQAALAMSNAAAFQSIREQEESLRQLSLQIMTAQETERGRISRELHDGVGQQLTAMKYLLESVRTAAKSNDNDKLMDRVGEARELARQIIEELRNISLDLRPTMLDDLGLGPTLDWLVRQYVNRHELAVDMQFEVDDEEVPIQIATAMYRILQEALQNVAKHAKAKRVTVKVAPVTEGFQLTITDNGIGFDPASLQEKQSTQGCSGMLNMKERARFLSGDFRLESSPGKGTTLIITIPVKERKR